MPRTVAAKSRRPYIIGPIRVVPANFAWCIPTSLSILNSCSTSKNAAMRMRTRKDRERGYIIEIYD